MRFGCGISAWSKRTGLLLIVCARSSASGRGLWSIDVKTGATFESSPAKPLINPPYAQLDSTTVSFYTISNDGKRFLLRVSPTAATTEVEQVHVILNWPSLLK